MHIHKLLTQTNINTKLLLTYKYIAEQTCRKEKEESKLDVFPLKSYTYSQV